MARVKAASSLPRLAADLLQELWHGLVVDHAVLDLLARLLQHQPHHRRREHRQRPRRLLARQRGALQLSVAELTLEPREPLLREEARLVEYELVCVSRGQPHDAGIPGTRSRFRKGFAKAGRGGLALRFVARRMASASA